MKEDLYLYIDYDYEHDFYCYNTNIKPEYLSSVLETFIQSQIGKGKDNSPIKEQEFYQIDLLLDLSFDIFSVKNNCGNLGLRDGILINLLRKLDNG